MPALRFCEAAGWDSLNFSFVHSVLQSHELVVHNGDTVNHAFVLGVGLGSCFAARGPVYSIDFAPYGDGNL